MSEHSEILPTKPEPGSPNPYNLDDFPAYKARLLEGASAEKAAQIEQTFDPDNADLLAVITDPEYSSSLSAEEHEAEFNTLYPAIDEVFALHLPEPKDMPKQPDGVADKQHGAAVENEPRPLPEYLDFWHDEAAAAELNGEHEAARVYRKNDRRLRQAQAKLNEPDATMAHASEWYLRMGSFSRMRGAEAKLAEAAHKPIADVSAEQRLTPAEQFLMSGAMLSEASFLNERSGKNSAAEQRHYEDEARKQFRGVQMIAHNKPELAGVSRQARVYESDLTMREAHRLAEEAQAKGGDENLMREATALAYEAIGDLQQVAVLAKIDMNEGANEDVRSAARGEVVERVILMLLREHAVAGRLAEEFPYQAFPRQDYPHDLLKQHGLPRQAFDVVQVRKRGSGDAKKHFEIPIQAKNRATQDQYDDRVIPMANVGGQVAGMVDRVPPAQLGQTGVREASPVFEELSHRFVAKMESTAVERQRRAA